MINTRRIYNNDNPAEQYLVYIDRLWPRGISKAGVKWDEWMKEISPSNELRKWFNHDPAKWGKFKKLYQKELTQKQDEIKKLKQLESIYGTLTLLYSAKDEIHNNAVVLRDFLVKQSD
jgi:uncharacterized protein YeaO (DUF488 family)